MDDLEKQQGTSSMLCQTWCIFSKPLVDSKWSYSSETPILGQNQGFFYSMQSWEIWWMTLKNNRTPLLCYVKLCASFPGQTVNSKLSIWEKISNFLLRVTLKLYRKPWKTIGHFCCITSSSVNHSIAIGEFKLELHSGNAQFGSQLVIFCSSWPWNLTDDLEKQQGQEYGPEKAVTLTFDL